MATALSVTAPSPTRHGKALLGTAIAGGGLLLVAVLGTVMAITGASITCLTTNPTTGPAPTRAAVDRIAPARLRLYQLAGRRFDINWAFLAAIGVQECASGDCTGVNPSGCAGPMQIAYVRDSPCSPGAGPTLWDRYQVSATGGVPNIDDPGDAIYTAARIFRQHLHAPPMDGSYHGYFEAACGYYGACADVATNYAAEVMARAVSFGFSGAGSPAPPNLTAAQAVASSGECTNGGGGGGPVNRNRIVQIAESQLGQSEHPPGSNCTKYAPVCEEWCALFVAWVWQHAGAPMPGGPEPYAYSGTIYTWVASHGGKDLPPSATPAPGDAVLYGTGPSDSVHVGIVQRVFGDGEIVTIEGNDDNQVLRNGPFDPADAVRAGEPAPIYGYAQPPAGRPGGADA